MENRELDICKSCLRTLSCVNKNLAKGIATFHVVTNERLENGICHCRCHYPDFQVVEEV